MVKVIIFRFIAGFGNRLCNLINMMYLHYKFPDAEIYVEWLNNNHCKTDITDIIDMVNIFGYIKFNYKYKGGEFYAATSNLERTKWDKIENWENTYIIVSVSFYIYSFISYQLAIEYFNLIPFKKEILEIVDYKKETYGINRNIIHFRDGDLLKLLEQNECADIKLKILEQLNEKKDFEIYHYDINIVDRNINEVLIAIADLIYLSKFNNIVGYSPYSHFSSWIYLLSNSFIDNEVIYPIFNYKKTNLVFIQ